ncbi:MAG: hypothetical protein K2G42_04760, partial [Clostridia bacterium]|nr:hypothetical protein [Clostridia bacterium]
LQVISKLKILISFSLLTPPYTLIQNAKLILQQFPLVILIITYKNTNCNTQSKKDDLLGRL